jgi:hypothetical protein
MEILVSIPDFLKNPDWFCFAIGFIFLVLGLFKPGRFLGIEMEWRPATSLTAILLAAALLAFSYPQLRFWKSNTVNIDRVDLETLEKNNKAALNAIERARRGAGNADWLFDSATMGLKPTQDNSEIFIKLLNRLAKKAVLIPVGTQPEERPGERVEEIVPVLALHGLVPHQPKREGQTSTAPQEVPPLRNLCKSESPRFQNVCCP